MFVLVAQAATNPSAPVIGASALSGTVVQFSLVSPSVEPVAGIASYELFYSTVAATGPWTLISSVAPNAFPYTWSSATAATAYWFMARGVDGSANHKESANSNIVPLTTPGSGGGGTGVKVHFASYAGSNNIYSNSNANTKWPQVQQEIDLALKNNPNVAGIYTIHTWPEIETSFGNYNWANVDREAAYIQQNYPGKRFGVFIFAQDFAHTDPTSQSVPGYVLSNPGTYGVGYDGSRGGYWQLGNYGSTCCWWRASIKGRLAAMFDNLANHTRTGYAFNYNNDPFFEMISFQESALDLASAPPDYSIGSSQTQWEALHAGIAGSFPNCNVADQNNFFAYTQSSPTVTGNVMLANVAAGVCPSSPDIYTSQPNPQTAFTWGQLAWIGSAAGGTPGFTSQRGKSMYISFVEAPDYTRSGGIPAITQSALNVLFSPQVWWTVIQDSSNPGNWPNVLANINAVPIPSANKVCPTNYAQRGGCNFS